jgi:hypothetical protein
MKPTWYKYCNLTSKLQDIEVYDFKRRNLGKLWRQSLDSLNEEMKFQDCLQKKSCKLSNAQLLKTYDEGSFKWPCRHSAQWKNDDDKLRESHANEWSPSGLPQTVAMLLLKFGKLRAERCGPTRVYFSCKLQVRRILKRHRQPARREQVASFGIVNDRLVNYPSRPMLWL